MCNGGNLPTCGKRCTVAAVQGRGSCPTEVTMANGHELDGDLVDDLFGKIDDFIEDLLEKNPGKEEEVHEAFRRVARNRYNMQKPPEDENENGNPDNPGSG
jgi:hypothetical protein